MAQAIMKWTMHGRSMLPDISTLPTRIQDIPKEILRMYGIIVGSEDPPGDSDDDDNEGVLVIDERPTYEVEVDLTENADEKHIVDLSQYASSENQVQITRNKAEPRRYKSRKLKKHESISGDNIVGMVEYCDICKKLVADLSIEEHKKKHCPQAGCQDILLDDVDRARHVRLHQAHPTKPFLCRFCKKRYSFYSNVEKHYKVCKVVRKTYGLWPKPVS